MAEKRYQAGVEEYSRGRFPQALASFQDALRLDPRDRSARVAADRVRTEIEMSATRAPETFPRSRATRGALSADVPFAGFLRAVLFERTLGDARSAQGALQAMQGRIAQLLSERKVARARRRSFAKNFELHALSRRLTTAVS